MEADLVVGVPDSGLVAAKGYSEESGSVQRGERAACEDGTF